MFRLKYGRQADYENRNKSSQILAAVNVFFLNRLEIKPPYVDVIISRVVGLNPSSANFPPARFKFTRPLGLPP